MTKRTEQGEPMRYGGEAWGEPQAADVRQSLERARDQIVKDTDSHEWVTIDGTGYLVFRWNPQTWQMEISTNAKVSNGSLVTFRGREFKVSEQFFIGSRQTLCLENPA